MPDDDALSAFIMPAHTTKTADSKSFGISPQRAELRAELIVWQQITLLHT